MTKRRRNLLLALVPWAALFCQPARGQDVPISQTNPYITLARGNSWGTAGPCSSGAACGVNNTYVWVPPTPDSTVCVAITNNSAINNHGFTFTLQQTLDNAVTSFTGNTTKWAAVPISGTTFPATVNAGTTSSFFFRSSSAARLALQVTGSVALGGANDTANIVVVQPSTASFCGSSVNATSIFSVIGATGAGNAVPATLRLPVLVGGLQQVTGVENFTAMFADIDSSTHGWIVGNADTNFWNGYNGTQWTPVEISTGNNASGHSLMPIFETGAGNDVSTPAANPTQVVKNYGTAVTDGWAWTSGASGCNANCGALFYANDTTNPAAGRLLASVTQTGTTGSITPARVTIACSVACDIFINKINDNGTTCTAAASVKAFDNNQGGVAQANTVQTGGCVANPAVQSQIKHVFIPASATLVVDLTGYWTQGTAAEGFDVVNGANIGAGTVSVTFEWNERTHPL